MAKKAKSKAKAAKPAKAKVDKMQRTPRAVKLTEADERLIGIVRGAKKTGITVEAVAKEFFGEGEVARPRQAVYFRVIAANKKLEALGEAYRIQKRNPGAARGKQIELFVEAA